MPASDEVDIHLAEYAALRSEIDVYNQRIDRITGWYVTALFGVTGLLLNPITPIDVEKYLDMVKASNYLIGLFLFLSILNSTLLISVASHFSAILAMAEHTSTIIGNRLSELAGSKVLTWDYSPGFVAKKTWGKLRIVGQALFFAISESISLAIIYFSWSVIFEGLALALLYFLAAISFFTSVVVYFVLGFTKWPFTEGEQAAPNDQSV